MVFQKYFSNREQLIQINYEENTELEIISFIVRQGSMLGLLLFLFYVDNLFLNPITFVDDANLLLTHNKRCLPGSIIHTEGFLKVFNAWTKSHFSNFQVG